MFCNFVYFAKDAKEKVAVDSSFLWNWVPKGDGLGGLVQLPGTLQLVVRWFENSDFVLAKRKLKHDNHRPETALSCDGLILRTRSQRRD